MPEAEVSVVLVTAPDGDTAERLGRVLVEERLAACVNVLPAITSIYRWEGRVETDEETLLMIKTSTGGFEALRRRVVELHPYDTPEVLTLDVRDGSREYLDWVLGSVGGAS
ncbi:MAG: divalent-cation tolerance protein CutA [Gemmatimonadota bacterium]